jgi:hypothetical protein
MFYMFRENDELRFYLERNRLFLPPVFALLDFKVQFSAFTRQKNLSYWQNPNIILCPPDLEAVLNRKVFHLDDFDGLVATHILPVLPGDPNPLSGPTVTPAPRRAEVIFRPETAGIFQDPEALLSCLLC